MLLLLQMMLNFVMADEARLSLVLISFIELAVVFSPALNLLIKLHFYKFTSILVII